MVMDYGRCDAMSTTILMGSALIMGIDRAAAIAEDIHAPGHPLTVALAMLVHAHRANVRSNAVDKVSEIAVPILMSKVTAMCMHVSIYPPSPWVPG